MKYTATQLKLLEQWRKAEEAAEVAKTVIETERELRKAVIASFAPTCEEGTVNLELPEGWKLKIVHKVERVIDQAGLQSVNEEVRAAGFNPDLLISWKPSLKMAIYKEMTAEQRVIFDKALTLKPGSDTAELVPPKGKK